MAFDSIRLPPDGAGKRIHTQKTVELDYDGGTGDGFLIGDEIFGKTTGASGFISRISSDSTSVAGTIHIIFKFDSVSFQNDEGIAIGSSGNSAIAYVDGTGTEGQVQQVVLVGGNNYTNSQNIDVLGSAYVRFTEGSPEFDVFGNIKISEGQILGAYYHLNDDLTNTTVRGFEETIIGAASGTYYPNTVSYLSSVTNASGDFIRRSTNRYHHYIPSQGQLSEFTIFTGDTGKANNVRRWGYFDQNDGYFFCLSGSNFGIVKRTSTAGYPVDQFISQSQFNGDTIDGSRDKRKNSSNFDLNITNLNLYWVDMAWLGAGTTRMGIFGNNGDRITVHKFENSNVRSGPHIKTPVLPVAYENENISSTSGVSEINFVCAAVKTQGSKRDGLDYPKIQESYISTPVTASIGTETTIFGITAAKNYLGKPNRIPVLPKNFGLYVNQPTRVNVYESMAPVSSSFELFNQQSAVDIDVSATGLGTNGISKFLKFTKVVHPGEDVSVDISNLYSLQSNYLTRTATGGTGSMVYLTVQPMSSATTSSIVEASITWETGFFV